MTKDEIGSILFVSRKANFYCEIFKRIVYKLK